MELEKKILITGTTGFIGYRLSAHLNSLGWSVVALNRTSRQGPWQSDYRFDLAAPAIEPEIFSDVQAVIHLAGIAHTSGFTAGEYAQNNTRASISLAMQALSVGVNRFVYFSSSHARPNKDNEVVSDDYAVSKADAELGLRRLSREQGLQLTVVRPALVYGAGVKGNLVKLLRAIKKGWLPLLPETPGGISMVAVSDVSGAIQAILDNDVTINKIYGLDDGEIYNPRRICLESIQALGRRQPSWSIPMTLLKRLAMLGDMGERMRMHAPLTSQVLQKLFVTNAYHDVSLAEDTGWRPANRLKDLLPEMIELI